MKAGHHNDRLLVIGHRGNGKNKTLLQGESPVDRPSIRENTITSFNTASKFGAEFVEFDVQVPFYIITRCNLIINRSFMLCSDLLSWKS